MPAPTTLLQRIHMHPKTKAKAAQAQAAAATPKTPQAAPLKPNAPAPAGGASAQKPKTAQAAAVPGVNAKMDNAPPKPPEAGRPAKPPPQTSLMSKSLTDSQKLSMIHGVVKHLFKRPGKAGMPTNTAEAPVAPPPAIAAVPQLPKVSPILNVKIKHSGEQVIGHVKSLAKSEDLTKAEITKKDSAEKVAIKVGTTGGNPKDSSNYPTHVRERAAKLGKTPHKVALDIGKHRNKQMNESRMARRVEFRDDDSRPPSTLGDTHSSGGVDTPEKHMAKLKGILQAKHKSLAKSEDLIKKAPEATPKMSHEHQMASRIRQGMKAAGRNHLAARKEQHAARLGAKNSAKFGGPKTSPAANEVTPKVPHKSMLKTFEDLSKAIGGNQHGQGHSGYQGQKGSGLSGASTAPTHFAPDPNAKPTVEKTKKFKQKKPDGPKYVTKKYQAPGTFNLGHFVLGMLSTSPAVAKVAAAAKGAITKSETPDSESLNKGITDHLVKLGQATGAIAKRPGVGKSTFKTDGKTKTIHTDKHKPKLKQIEATSKDKSVKSKMKQVYLEKASKDEEDTVKTKHSHEPNFGKHVHDCARCKEIKGGSPARAGYGDSKKKKEAASAAGIKAHFDSDHHKSGKCGPVCTFGDW